MVEKKNSTIKITLSNGEYIAWSEGEWDDCGVKDGVFIVMKDGRPVGFYNMDSVIYAVVR